MYLVGLFDLPLSFLGFPPFVLVQESLPLFDSQMGFVELSMFGAVYYDQSVTTLFTSYVVTVASMTSSRAQELHALHMKFAEK